MSLSFVNNHDIAPLWLPAPLVAFQEAFELESDQ